MYFTIKFKKIATHLSDFHFLPRLLLSGDKETLLHFVGLHEIAWPFPFKAISHFTVFCWLCRWHKKPFENFPIKNIESPNRYLWSGSLLHYLHYTDRIGLLSLANKQGRDGLQNQRETVSDSLSWTCTMWCALASTLGWG